MIGLVEQFGGAREVLAVAARQPARLGLEADSINALVAPDEKRLEADLSWLGGETRNLVTWNDERYPALLRRIGSPPAALFVEGDADALWQPQLAIIGSRNPTAGGLGHARSFSAEIARLGIAVVSGLASGIDAAAHQPAVDAAGVTIAVTGTGLDRVYPASSAPLAERIVQAGALVSEFPPDTPARRSHFPSRNRIIAGLSLGVLVVEAGLNSGSLITARQAAEQGKEVFALPGSLHNPMVKGCHRLIKQGARLVENTHEILEALAPLAGDLAGELQKALEKPAASQPAKRSAELLDDPEYQRLWGVLSFDPKPVDELVHESGLGVREVSSMLLMLELRGLIQGEAGSTYCRK
ncbi:MAG: DNA-processing protein DprA [Halioglobus sp.]|nr:DNA-processing protein DprA [Halioglobus sp.]